MFSVSRNLTAGDMRRSLSLLTIGLILATGETLEVTEASLSPAQRLLQALGEDFKVILYYFILSYTYFRKANKWARHKH